MNCIMNRPDTTSLQPHAQKLPSRSTLPRTNKNRPDPFALVMIRSGLPPLKLKDYRAGHMKRGRPEVRLRGVSNQHQQQKVLDERSLHGYRRACKTVRPRGDG